MAIVTGIAGAYTGAYNRRGAGLAALNYTRTGYTINFTQKGERIEETDLYGLCLIEIVGRGCQATMDTICKVYSAVTVGAMFPWSGTPGLTIMGSVYAAGTPIAQLANDAPDVLILTAVPNTPAALAAAPATLTAYVIMSPDNNTQIVLNSTLREVPLKWECLLQDSTGTGQLMILS